jgi:hypothetical protein
LLTIDSGDRSSIAFTARQISAPVLIMGSLTLGNAQPPRVQSFIMRLLGPGETPVHVTLDATLPKRVIDEIESDLTEYYVDASVAAKMNEALDAHARAGDYNGLKDGNEFAEKLTGDLRAIGHDGHLRADFNPIEMPAPHVLTAEDRVSMREQMLAGNCAFDKVEILPGNIGYVKFDAFMDADICGATVAAAMGFVAHADALIFGLRDNRGGQPAMASLIASYLFDKPAHLNDLYDRHENSTTQFWTLAWVPGERKPTRPVFVLTSHRTFSGGEEFAYDLKTQKRATIVGETTGGGAHPVSGHPVADYFMIGVPFATAINPITKTSWEGTGVEPDVKVSADDGLSTAEKLAADQIHTSKAAEHAPPPGGSEPVIGDRQPSISTVAARAAHRQHQIVL